MILKEKCSGSSKKQSKKQKKMTANLEDKIRKCPLCLETLELDDLNFYPCTCGYQVCRFCWHRIRTNENCLCPACRRQYPEDPVTFKPLTQEELQKVKTEKKMKEIQKKKEIAESRKQLANIRVVQKNLVYVHGLPLGIDSDEDRHRKILQIFKEYGPVSKCIINNKTNYAGSQSHRASAYVTYQKIDDALKAFRSLPHTRIEGLEVKTSLGTTKYCSNFLKNVHCPKQDCMYLHEIAEEELCFTKEQIHAGEHLACGNMLFERMLTQMQQKNNHISRSKESIASEPEVEEKQICEKVKLKEDSCGSSEASNSPVQSKLQHLFSNREPQTSVFETEFENRFGSQHSNHSLLSEKPRSSIPNGEHHTQMSLPEESNNTSNIHSSVNNLHNGLKSYQNFPQSSQDLHNGDLWNEHRPPTSRAVQPSSSSNHHSQYLYQNGLANEFNLMSNGTTTSSILSRLPIAFTSNGTNESRSDKFEPAFEQYDDDLGFDPCQISLKGLEDLINSEEKSTSRVGVDLSAAQKNLLIDSQKQPTLQSQSMLQLIRLRQAQLQKQQRNPPPGFSGNGYSPHPTQPLPSPVFESRNPLPNRINPVINVSSAFHSTRPNYPLPRLQQQQQQSGMSISNSGLTNGFSPQSLRSFAVSKPQTLQDLLPRSTMNGQQGSSQRFDNLSQPQYPTVDQGNLSPSFWNNIGQTSWMPGENGFQNQGIGDFRPASPSLNMRRIPQMRPTEVNRQVQQLTARYSNLSPFSDNSQYLFPNNQLTKGVHTFP